MKKITLLSALLFFTWWGSQAQCIRTNMYPSTPIVSNNMGTLQAVPLQPFTSEYSQVSNLVVGVDYIFTCKQGTTDKYITVTDLTNTVITQGPSPLTVEGIAFTDVRLHYSENEACGSATGGNTITITALLTCNPPVNLSVSDITTTTATFAWEPNGDETAWEALVVPNGTATPTASTTGTEITTNPTYTYSDLTAANKYQFYVRANCGNEFSPWNGPLNFASGCDPIESFSENFETAPVGELPICWTQIKNGEGSSQYSVARVINFAAYSPANVVQIASEDTAPTANIMLATPALGNLSAGTHRLKFFARSGSGLQNLQFGTVNTTTPDAEFTAFDEITAIAEYQEYTIDYTTYDGTDTYIAIRYNGAQYNSVLIDNIRWELAPLCTDVSDITIPTETITATTATINWLANGDDTVWDVVYGPITVTDPSTLTPITPSPTGSQETNLTGLTDNTRYNVWVRSVCGENLGVWIGPETFKTLCVSTTAINENFDSYTYGSTPDCWSAIKNGEGLTPSASAIVTDNNFNSASRAILLATSNSPATAHIMMASPEISNIASGTQRLKFYAKSSGATGSVQVGTVDVNTVDAVFTSIETIPLTSTFTEYVVEFTDTSITDAYFAFRHNTGATYTSVYIDDVRWEPIPTCADVTGISAGSPDINSATISWTAGGSETTWDVVYGATTVTDPNTLTPVSPAPTVAEITLTGLTDNTSYKVWVRSSCGDDKGAWIGPLTFKTPCVAITSFEENFDALAYLSMPSCWSLVKNGVGASQAASSYVIDYNFVSPSRAIMIYNEGSIPATSNIMLITPNLGNIAAGTHRIKFSAKSSSATGSLQVGTVNNATSSAVFTEMETIALTSTHTEFAINFTSYEGTDTFIAFRHNTPTTYSSIAIDDVIWEAAPLCADVADIAVADITTETANVSWESQGNETNWQVVYGPVTTTDPTTLDPSELLTETNFSVTGLTENTVYKVWVRSACGEENGMWMGPKQFTTKCVPSTVPFMEDFETAVTPAMPSCTTLQNLSTGNNFITNSLNNYGFTSKVLQYSYNCATTVAANAWYYTKGLMLTEGVEYTISYKYGGNTSPTGNFVEKLKVLYGTDTDAESMTNELDDHTFTTNTPTENEVSFVPEATGIYYFGFNVYSNACQNNVYIDDIAIEEVLATSDFNASDFKFYPNPVKDVLHLSYTQSISDVAVYNLLGQKVISNSINANEAAIDMSSLSSGSYIVKITSEDQTKTVKIIKE